jgi:hypothetical protein
MKKQFYFALIIVIASTMFFSAPAKAQSTNNSTGVSSEGFLGDILGWLGFGDGSSSSSSSSGKTGTTTGTSGTTSGQSSTALPINNGIVFLMLGGFAIGITTVAKARKLKPVAAKA